LDALAAGLDALAAGLDALDALDALALVVNATGVPVPSADRVASSSSLGTPPAQL
jgi:hypothetical protein